MQKRTVFSSCFCLLLALCLLLSWQLPALSAETLESGDFGEGLHWELDGDNTLRITGTGAMPDYEPNLPPPWDLVRDNISKVSVESGVTAVGSYSFVNCSKLSEVELSETVTEVREAAFCQCSSLASITVSGENGALCDVGSVLFSKDGKTLLLYPEGKDDERYEVPAGVEVLATGAFLNSSVNQLILPEGLLRLGARAIRGCNALTYLEMPSSLRVLGENAICESSLKMIVRFPDETALLAGIRLEGEIESIMFTGFQLGENQVTLHRLFLYGGSSLLPYTLLAAEGYPFPALPSLEPFFGAHFHCWYYTDGNGMNLLDPAEGPFPVYSFDTDQTLYVMWWGSVLVGLHPCGGTLSGSTELVLSEDENFELTALPEAPTRPGWRFTGWYLSPDGDDLAAVGMRFPNGTDLYARWESILTFEERDAEPDALETVLLPSAVGADPEPEPQPDPDTPIGPNGEIPEAANEAALQSEYTPRWGKVVTNYAVPQADGSLLCVTYRVGMANGVLYLSRYSAEDELLFETTLETELPIFGGFFAGENYYYVVTGQKNMDEDPNLEVIRVTRYDKDWNRIDAASVRDCYTTIPFNAGSLRMAENGNSLMIHTSRQRYKTGNVYHQSQLTIWIDTETMSVVNDVGMYQVLHVSHSFNQFVLPYEDGFALLDHGDAYPRSVVVHRLIDPGSMSQLELLTIPGSIGANYTGVGVGGFAATEGAFTAAVNRADGEADGQEYRNVVVMSSPADSCDGSDVVVNVLTDYVSSKKCASTPWLVRLSDEVLCLLWEEYQMGEDDVNECLGVRYVFLNGNATPLTDRYLLTDARLSGDCQPVVWNGRVVWFANGDEGRTLYRLRYPDTDAADREIAVTAAQRQGDELKVTVLNFLGGATASFAWYGADGQFLGMQQKAVGFGVNVLRLSDCPEGAVCKAFFTGEETRPIVEAQTIG